MPKPGKTAAKSAKALKTLFALVVWGEDYVRDFLKVSLPTLLGEGNISDPTAFGQSLFLILTRAEDIAVFEADPLFRRLGRTIPVEFREFDTKLAADKYRLVSRGQAEALRRSEAFDALIFLYPDMIWPRGGVTYALERIAAGSLGVFTPAPAVLPAQALAELNADPACYRDTEDGRVWSPPPRKLAGIALKHHHPMWDSFDWDGDGFTSFPSCLRWNVGGEGWLIRCFHLHPLALKVQPDNPVYYSRFTTSLDGEYVARLFSERGRLDFATDTDEFAMLTLREGVMPPFPGLGLRSRIATVAHFAEAHAYLLHRAFSDIKIRYHDTDLDEAAWAVAEKRSDDILAQVKDRLAMPDSIIKIEDPAAWRARQRRRQMSHYWLPSRDPLPASYARKSRLELLDILWRNLIARAALQVSTSRFAGMLRRWGLARRIRSQVVSPSENDQLLSAFSLIRAILSPRRDS